MIIILATLIIGTACGIGGAILLWATAEFLRDTGHCKWFVDWLARKRGWPREKGE